jgi:hypothetical protein
VHREDERAVVAGAVQAGDELLRVGLEAVGVVVADVRVRVEPRRARGHDGALGLVQRPQEVVMRLARRLGHGAGR